jgi:hypothetical protein
MVGSFSSNASRPSPGSFLDRWLAKRAAHADTFDCGVRVLSGVVVGEGPRWRYRRSATDPLIVRGVVTLYHGPKITLHLTPEPGADAGPRLRPGHVQLSAVVRGSGARIQVSVPAGDLERFGLDPG